jgi:Transcriptional regulator, AbiEi antitoxin
MGVDLKAAIVGNMSEIKKAISEKSSEVARLERELKRHQTVLTLLSENGRATNAKAKRRHGGSRGDLRAVLSRVPETFTSKEFVKEASRTKKQPIYIRQTLSRWAREGKIKRLRRGKYQKIKRRSADHLAA